MTTDIYIDPKIDIYSKKTITIIVHFKTKPAKVAMLQAEAQGVLLTLEEAKRDVDESHDRFQKEVNGILGEKQIAFSITHTYKSTFNGVSMRLPANEIKRLLQSTEIAAIYANQGYHLHPPFQPY